MLKSVSYFNNPSWRRIISQFREIFNELHLQVDAIHDEERIKTENLSLSDICLEANQKYLNVIENEIKFIPEVMSEEDESLKDSLRLMLKVWKLCQIIFIKSSPPGALLIDLQEWYRSTTNIDPMVQELFSTYASNIDMIYQDQNYWLLILIAVAQGRIETARHLLSFHPSKNMSVFKSVDEQLRSMPNFMSLGHLSLFEFKAKWEYWQKKCIQVLTNENFSTEQTGSLEIICKMLCADESTFLELKPIFNSWYYMLISLVSYSNPTFNISDLHLHLSSKTCMRQFENELDEFDTIIHNIFDFDVESVVRDCVELFGNNMFGAHLMDILYLNGKLQLNKQELSMTVGVELSGPAAPHGSENANILYEEHLSAYASQLIAAFGPASTLSMHQIAFDYLLKCKLDANDLIEAYMEKIALTQMSEYEANKLFHLAFEYNFHDLAFSIGRIMQMRAFKRDMYGTALGWNVRIKDLNFGTLLAEKLLDLYFSTQDLNLLDLVENLSKELIYCDRLIFLSKYREFLRFQTNKTDSKQAACILVQLLEANNLVPVKYRRRLLLDVLPLVKQNVLTEEQIFSVLRSIQNYENRIEFLSDDNSKLNRHMGKKLNINDDKEADQKWQELLVELGDKLADAFALKSIEILN